MANFRNFFNKKTVKIIVTSNCQTHGIASALQQMVPSIEVIPIWKLSGDEFIVENLTNFQENEIIWVNSIKKENIRNFVDKSRIKLIKSFSIPEIFFDAFHPDMTYFLDKNKSIIESPIGHYHSKVAMWGFSQGKKIPEILEYYQIKIFEKLGYTNKFKNSINFMKNSFDNSNLNFDIMNEILFSREIFMHTFNHPKQVVLSRLAEFVCHELEYKPELNYRDFTEVSPDTLFNSGPIYPVFPSVANLFGYEGSTKFRKQDGTILSLEKFIEKSYQIYKELDTQSTNFEDNFENSYMDLT
jgi:hypothetical protein